MDQGSRRFAAALLGVVALALLLRGIEYALTALVFDDTAHYIDLATMLLQGRLQDVARHPYHPLFAAAIAATNLVVPDRVAAAMLFSVVAGALAAVPLVLAWRIIAGEKIALVAGLLYAVAPYPVRYAAAGYSEALYFLLFFTSVWLALRTLRLDSWASALLCGLTSGFAYLVRPEGAGVFVLLGLVLVVRLLVRRGAPLRARIRPLVGCLVAFVLLGAPYVVYKYETTGTFQLTGKKSIAKMLGIGAGEAQEPPGIRGEGRYADLGNTGRVAHVAENLGEALGPLFFTLAAVGALFGGRPRRRTGRELFLLGLVVFYLAAHFLLLRAYGYVSRRHAMPLACVMLGWSAAGLVTLAVWGEGAWRRLRTNRRPPPRWVLPLLLAVLVAAGTVPKAITPQWTREVPIREAGRWIADHHRGASPPRVCTPYKWGDPRIPIYAGVSIDQPTLANSHDMLAYFEATRPDYLAILPYRLAEVCPDAEAVRAHPRLQLVFARPYLGEEGKSVEVYRFLPEGHGS